MQDNRNTWLGTVLIIGSAVAYSLSGYFTRLIALDVWTVLFWRGIFGGFFIAAYLLWSHGKDLRETIRAIGLWVTICFIHALRLAPVADVMTIGAAIPFMTALMALVFMGEREGWSTWGASFIALAGVTIIVNPHASGGYLAGYAFAMITALSYAAMMIIIRENRHVSMLPAACLSAFLCAFVVLPFSQPTQVPAASMFDLILFGTAQFGLGLLLMTAGTRLISATRSALIASIENPLAPLWVWLAFGETPALATWIGGSLVMGAVVLDILVKSGRKRNPVDVPAGQDDRLGALGELSREREQ
ncbi:DMT family transporter [Rhizobiaceae bacterium BDR2-2]|uniref:DMT family transporter n=1 Tax=Ectorhizobium quercum TaxID=2965071 RepID=A0AAE3MXU9_9HYPH|nr:EamA family transporter [Ectorhizobium quercum]MCX8997218.1 DMT family transporter [Ectorhizobium quercum]